MKFNAHFLLLFFLVFLVSSRKSFGQEIKGKKETKGASMEEINGRNQDSFNELMGVEACGQEDRECLKGRAIAEVHLDYIYTQQHNP